MMGLEKQFHGEMNHECIENNPVVEVLDPNYDFAERDQVLADAEVYDYERGVHYPNRSLKFHIRFRSVCRHLLGWVGSRGY